MRKVKFFCSTFLSSKRSTHECFSFILTLGKLFAMFPVDGLSKPDFRSLSFRWVSWSTFYTITYLSGLLIIMGFQIYNMSQLPELKFGYFVTLLFYLCSFTTTLLFLRLARCWAKLMKQWTETDHRMRSYGFCTKLSRRLKTIATVVLSAALKHALYLTTTLTKIPGTDGWEIFKWFLKNNFKSVFDYVPFAVWKGLLVLAVNIMCTFTWNYMDLYIMLISTALAVKFKQITSRLRMASINKPKNIDFWRELRSDYNMVSHLCNSVDNAVSDIVLLSFANNLFVILVQLFNSLKPGDGSAVGKIYFVYSFGFLLLRTIAVSLYASSINENSREPTALLLSTTPEVYNIEIERFLYKIQADPCALTGKKFFNVTKSLILSIAGAIVTYELVLIQFQVVI